MSEHIDPSPDGALHEGMLEVLAEHYSMELSHKVTRDLREKAEKGLANGLPPFGYCPADDGQHEPPVILPEEGAAVRTIFEMSTKGERLGDIAAWLNSNGYRARAYGKKAQARAR